ncbi:MAG: DUF429 domain-containing protein [Hyphomonadaceae bacterium]
MMTSFIGVDLAWQCEGNHSGLAAFHGDLGSTQPVSFGTGATDLDAVTDFILANRTESSVVAIDAPLIIENVSGQRPCETLVSKRFGSAHAGAHTSNLRLYPNAGGVALARRLESLGFRHCASPDTAWSTSGHWFFEVYPHPAQVVLFQRERIIKYKKGPVAARKSGLMELRQEIRSRMLGSGHSLQSNPALLEFLSQELASLRGVMLKRYEDALDAIVCSFLAFHLWRWGWQRSELIGDLASGYIVLPTVPLPRNSEPDA